MRWDLNKLVRQLNQVNLVAVFSAVANVHSLIYTNYKECHHRCVGKLDRWEGSQKHNSYNIQKIYILKI